MNAQHVYSKAETRGFIIRKFNTCFLATQCPSCQLKVGIVVVSCYYYDKIRYKSFNVSS